MCAKKSKKRKSSAGISTKTSVDATARKKRTSADEAYANELPEERKRRLLRKVNVTPFPRLRKKEQESIAKKSTEHLRALSVPQKPGVFLKKDVFYGRPMILGRETKGSKILGKLGTK